MLQLMLPRGAIEMTLRLGNESILPDCPHLEAADADALPSSTGTGVGANQRPVIESAVAQLEEVVKKYLQIWKGRHESLHSLGNGLSAYGGNAVIYGERAVGRVKAS